MKSVNKIILGSAIFLSLLVLGGCATDNASRSQYVKEDVKDADIIALSHAVARALAKDAGLAKGDAIIVASFADINALDTSSPFGRIVSQQVASALSGLKYHVIELLLRDNVYIKTREGEFLLSRQIKNLVSKHDAVAVLTGAYAVGSRNVYVTAKLIRTRDNVVLSAHYYNLPLGPDTRKLIGRR